LKKRILSTAALLIICLLTLTACGKKETSLYNAVCKNYAAADGVSVEFTSTFKLDEGGTATDGVFAGTYQIAQKDGAVTAAHLSGTLTMSISNGEVAPVPVEMYYANGKLYAVMSGSKYYTAATWEQARELIGPVGELLAGYEETDFREMTLTEDGDSKKLSFTLNSAAAEKIPGITEEWRRIAAMGSAEEPQMTMNVLTGYIITDKKDAASQNISYAGTVSTGERTLIVQNTIDSRFSYEAVEITVPDEAEYKEINK